MVRDYPSKFVDQHLACWIEAIVHQADTHVKWSGSLCERRDNENKITQGQFISNYFCDTEMFLDWIKRGVICKVEKEPEGHIIDTVWEEIEKTIKICQPIIVIPLTEERQKECEQYRMIFPRKSGHNEELVVA